MAIGDMLGMMKQAKQLQEKMETMQAEVASMEVEGSSGGGMVKVVVNGKGEVQSVKIDPSLVTPDEVEILEDLIVAAATDARTRSDQMLQDKMQEMTGGMSLPAGMKLPF